MRSEPPRVGAIILAAGASTRLGRPKQLLQWQGQSLLRRAAAAALEAGLAPVVVVLGSLSDALKPELRGLDVIVTVNPAWEEGMASSLQAGLRRLTATESDAPSAVLLLLCDQPLVTASDLRALRDRFAADSPLAVASEYEPGIVGPPCVFARALFPRLLALSGAQGARGVLAKLPPEQLSRIPFPQGLADVDTPDDWEKMKREQ